MKRLAILGSTGSVGSQTCRVLERNPGRFQVDILSAHKNVPVMERQVRVLQPKWAVMTDIAAAAELKHRLADTSVQVLSGVDSLLELITVQRPELLVAAMVGHHGLLPVIAAIESGCDIALANKEVLVMAGALIKKMSQHKGVKLIPLDSEHSAIFQCLEGNRSGLKRIILTASGGPFRGRGKDYLTSVTPGDAVKHPNWTMGAKISVDSATLMNKGLEVIEAHWLFDVVPERIDVLVHPQSIIHSLVEFIDGAVLAQMGIPSMEVPIQYALSWPKRWSNPQHYFIDWMELGALTFEKPDTDTFPCLGFAYTALERGGNAPAVLTVSNDVCVEAFLAGMLPFNKIPEIIAEVIAQVPVKDIPDIRSVLDSISMARQLTADIIKSKR